MRTGKRVAVVIASVAIVIGAGGGIALASIPDSNGVLHGCVKGSTASVPGDLIIKDDGGTGDITCGTGATKVTIPTDRSAVIVESIPSLGSASATCPNAWPTIVGGGGTSSDSSVPLSDSHPGFGAGTAINDDPPTEIESGTGQTWFASVTDPDVNVTAYALCTK